jgi:hypothetical protein
MFTECFTWVLVYMLRQEIDTDKELLNSLPVHNIRSSSVWNLFRMMQCFCVCLPCVMCSFVFSLPEMKLRNDILNLITSLFFITILNCMQAVALPESCGYNNFYYDFAQAMLSFSTTYFFYEVEKWLKNDSFNLFHGLAMAMACASFRLDILYVLYIAEGLPVKLLIADILCWVSYRRHKNTVKDKAHDEVRKQMFT